MSLDPALGETILSETRAILGAGGDRRVKLSNFVEMLGRRVPRYTWAGIYLLEGETLVLGPYVGRPTEHARIPVGEGICGAAASAKETVIVDDVKSDPRYLACSLETRSEIVVPILRDGRCVGEIDIDSDDPAAFGAADRDVLEAAAARLATLWP